MEIHVPETIKQYEPELRLVFDLMTTKLNLNRHKGFGESSDFNGLLAGMEAEIQELKDAFRAEDQMSAVMESIDCSNFGVLIAIMFLRRTKADYKQMQVTYRELDT